MSADDSSLPTHEECALAGFSFDSDDRLALLRHLGEGHLSDRAELELDRHGACRDVCGLTNLSKVSLPSYFQLLLLLQRSRPLHNNRVECGAAVRLLP
jgi:hypothetical protein